ncbi:CPm [Dregea volubilis virus 1]|nr:CPm [Dregea volubilis virus 1]
MAQSTTNTVSASSILTDPEIAAKSSVITNLSKLDLNSISYSSSLKFTAAQADDLYGAVTEHLRSLTKGSKDDDLLHFAVLMGRAGYVQTSKKKKYDEGYEYTISGVKYEVKDASIFPFIIEATKKYPKENGLRAFFSTFEHYYLFVAKLKPELFETRLATRRGVPLGMGYLAADFLSGSAPTLNNHERAVINRASENALYRSFETSASKELVSLYDLGK